MKFGDLITSAVHNTFRSKARTILTVIAIFIGAFTLTLTNGIGTGVNNYIDNQLSSIGQKDVLIVQKKADQAPSDGSPAKYDPNTQTSSSTMGSAPGMSMLTQSDVDSMKTISGVNSVDPVVGANAAYIQNGDGEKYQLQTSVTAGLTNPQMLAGKAVADDGTMSIQIPDNYVKPLGFSSNEDAVGKNVKIAVKNPMQQEQINTVKISGVEARSLMSSAIGTNNDTMQKMHQQQTEGLPASATNTYYAAMAKFSNPDNKQHVTDIKKSFDDKGFQAQTIDDQLGSFKAVVDGIVMILNGFAAIALLAASFGIINTLLMSVQERTREIGLMKAMGMSNGKIFGLFSAEAVFIGFLGSVIGAAVAVLVGSVISKVLSQGLLKDLPGLQLISFTPWSIIGVILAIMFVAFLAGTIPAYRASKQNPIEALRYE
ncbi:MAG: FtsX-like permease family protein [Micrococcaceae bacterium]